MTDDEIRIAIAEACGLNTKKEVLGGVFVYRDKQGYPVAALPNYCHDLNAMHEAERILCCGTNNNPSSGDKWSIYLDLLRLLICEDADEPVNVDLETEWDMVTATAHQRAEAFLRTIGKWKQ